MILSKPQLKAHTFAAQDEDRPNLGHVKVEPGGRITATNGRCAVVVEPIGQQKIEETEFPEIQGLEGESPRVPVFLPRDTARAAAAIAGEAARMLLNGHLVIGATDGTTPQLVMTEHRKVEDYPNVDAMMPIGQPEAYVTLNPEFLLLVARYAKAFDKPANGVKLSIFGPAAAVRFEWMDDHHRVTALVMPMRDERWPEEPTPLDPLPRRKDGSSDLTDTHTKTLLALVRDGQRIDFDHLCQELGVTNGDAVWAGIQRRLQATAK